MASLDVDGAYFPLDATISTLSCSRIRAAFAAVVALVSWVAIAIGISGGPPGLLATDVGHRVMVSGLLTGCPLTRKVRGHLRSQPRSHARASTTWLHAGLDHPLTLCLPDSCTRCRLVQATIVGQKISRLRAGGRVGAAG